MTVGQQLQAARKARRLSVDDVASAIRLRAGLVEAIERDDLSALGGDVYAKGHLRAYARFVEIDENDILATYAEQIGADAPSAAVAAEPEPMPAAARSLPLAPVASLADGAKSLRPVMHHKREANWTTAMVVALVVVALIGGIAIVGKLGQTSKQNNLGLPKVTTSPTPGTHTPSPTPSPSATTPSAPPSNLVAQLPGATVQLDIAGTPSWVSVTGNSKGTLFQGIMAPGTTQTFNDRKGVKLVLGNAGAVTVTVNGNNLGVAGAAGQVVRMAFGPDGAPA